MEKRPIGQRSTKWHEDKARATKGAVLQGAAKVFDEVGYRHAVVSAISAASNTSPGAMYHYFASKQEIGLAVLSDFKNRWFASPKGTPSSPLGRLIAITHGQVQLLQQDTVVRAGFRLVSDPDPISEAVPEFWKAWLQAIEDLLRQAAESGEVDEQEDCERLAWSVVTNLVGVFVVMRSLASDDAVLSKFGNALAGSLVSSVTPAYRERILSDINERFDLR